ncbi:MAG: choice-of-anchor Q domain-containing protein [Gemmataceae bacterium]
MNGGDCTDGVEMKDPGAAFICRARAENNAADEGADIYCHVNAGTKSDVEEIRSLVGIANDGFNLAVTSNNNQNGTKASQLGAGFDPAGLANNGGPTQTVAILTTSKAVDNGDNPLSLNYDQRGLGFPRTIGV